MSLSKSIPFIGLVCAVTTMSGLAATKDVQANERCRAVHAHVETFLTSEACQSPVGLCTKGHIVGGPFHASTTFLTLNAAPAAGMPGTEPAENLSYSGTFTATQNDGTFVASDLGVFDVSHEAFTELSRSVSGTGRFSDPSGTLTISGALIDNNTGFDGFADGILCTDRPDDDWWPSDR
ncbi:MAG TPA: hypothetical protein VHV30_04775 [Polyangiaceae bacterium]|nr:hypothetical protein [Polyangiaceae bacterium]